MAVKLDVVLVPSRKETAGSISTGIEIEIKTGTNAMPVQKIPPASFKILKQ